jgi:hypothetical protein
VLAGIEAGAPALDLGSPALARAHALLALDEVDAARAEARTGIARAEALAAAFADARWRPSFLALRVHLQLRAIANDG